MLLLIPTTPGSSPATQNAKVILTSDPRCDPVSSELSKIEQRKVCIRNVKKSLRYTGMEEIEPSLKLKVKAYKKLGALFAHRVVSPRGIVLIVGQDLDNDDGGEEGE
jgi:hypothetical protein